MEIIQYILIFTGIFAFLSLGLFFIIKSNDIKKKSRKAYSENIKKLRMKHALTMLQDQDLSVTDIAETLGYYDASNFRHVFKSFYHMTPQEYRNSLLAGKHTEKSPEPQTDSFSG